MKIYRYMSLETFTLTMLNGLRFAPCSEYWSYEDDQDGRMQQFTFDEIRMACEQQQRLLNQAAGELKLPFFFGPSTKSRDDWSKYARISCWSTILNSKFLWSKFCKDNSGIILEADSVEFERFVFEYFSTKPPTLHHSSVAYVSAFTPESISSAERSLFSGKSGQYRVINHLFIKHNKFFEESEYRFALHNWGNDYLSAGNTPLYIKDFHTIINRVWIHHVSRRADELLIGDILKSKGSLAVVTRLTELN